MPLAVLKEGHCGGESSIMFLVTSVPLVASRLPPHLPLEAYPVSPLSPVSGAWF